ncbi:MAG: transposase [Phycisphaerae bacterium]|nr:transposase [Phycisphaerae bacterium]
MERCINWLKETRRFAMRYEKLAVNFLAMTQLAIIQRCFRVLHSSDRPWYDARMPER